MKVDVTVEIEEDEESILRAADAWYEAMLASNSLCAVPGYERTHWADSGKEHPYGFARARFEELIYDLNIPHEASVRLIEAVDDSNEVPTKCLKRSAKFIFTGERW